MAQRPITWRIALRLSTAEHGHCLEPVLEALGGATTLSEDAATNAWELAAYVDAEPDRAALETRLAAAAADAGFRPPAIAVEALPDTDWVRHVQSRTPPVEAGRFFVHGSHHAEGAPAGRIGIRLDAGAAFGTGGHESTRGCLLALDRLAARRHFAAALDMGCGSGILAIAIALLWRCPVVACDNDVTAVHVAAENAAANGVAERVTVLESDGFDNPALRRRAPFDLIAANILAGPLIGLAPALADHLAPGGVAVLSGLLSGQAGDVAAAYETQGLAALPPVQLGDWRTLVMEKPGS